MKRDFRLVKVLTVVLILGGLAVVAAAFVCSHFVWPEGLILQELQDAQKVIVETTQDGNAYTIKILVSAEETIPDVPKTRFNPEKLKEHGFEQADTSEPGKQFWIRPAKDV